MAVLGTTLLILLGLILLAVFVSLIILIRVRVPYVKTPHAVIRFICEEIPIGPHDTVYDLGAGDGAVLAAIQESTDARVLGFELAPIPMFFAKIRALLNRGIPRVELRNFLEVDLSPASVVFCFLAPAAMPKLAEKLKRELKPGTRVISYGFQFPGWTPKKTLNPNPERTTATKLYVYTK